MIRKRLLAMGDGPYREFNTKIIAANSNTLVIGVRVPQLRALAKELASGDYAKTIRVLDENCHEENMLHGMIIGYCKDTCQKKLELLEHFVPLINNWAVCDCTVSTLKFTNKNKDAVYSFISRYLHSDKEYEVRFATIMLLSYYVTDQYVKDILRIIPTITHDGYYAKMAVAWLIQTAFAKYRDPTLELLKTAEINTWTFNKALQKIVESRYTSTTDKEMMRGMKRP